MANESAYERGVTGITFGVPTVALGLGGDATLLWVKISERIHSTVVIDDSASSATT